MERSRVTTGRAGSGPRQEAWTRFRTGLFNPQVILIILATLVLIVGVFSVVSVFDRALGWVPDLSVNAFLLGALLATALWALLGVIALATGATSWFLGSQAEQWTAKALNTLGADWRVFHNVTFLEGHEPNTWLVDIDHVAVGPGGVLVVETKYTSNALDLDVRRMPKYVGQAVDQADRNAGRVRALLSRDFPNVLVSPVVVWWGWRLSPRKTAVRHVGNTSVVAGGDVEKWRFAIATTGVLSEATIEGVSRKLERYVVDQRALEARRARSLPRFRGSFSP